MPRNGNFLARLEAKMRAAKDAPAFETADGSILTYAELLDQVARAAAALKSLGLKPGDRVMAQVEKSLPSIYLYLATLKIGAVYNPLNSAYTAAELEYFIGDAEPKVIVASAERIAEIEPAAAAHKVRSLLTMAPDGSGSFSELAAGQRPLRRTAKREPDDLASLIYTSGTTGRSKGAMITHRNIASNAETLHAYWGFVPGDVLLHALPIFHVHGLFVALHTALLNGSRILWMPKFDLEELMRLLPRATVLMGVPTFYTRLLGSSAFGPKHCKQAAPRHLGLGAAAGRDAPRLHPAHRPQDPRALRHDRDRHEHVQPLRGGRGCRARSATRCPRCACAWPTPRAARAAGDVGVLEVKGPNVFKGYWRNPKKTREEFRKDGYFITGDLATMDEDGRVTIVGRAKDLIITGGFNVYPKEIESELNSCRASTSRRWWACRIPISARASSPSSRRCPARSRRARPRSSSCSPSGSPSSSCLSGYSWPRSCRATPWARCRRLELAKQYADLFKG